jgi:hypothetical protein
MQYNMYHMRPLDAQNAQPIPMPEGGLSEHRLYRNARRVFLDHFLRSWASFLGQLWGEMVPSIPPLATSRVYYLVCKNKPLNEKQIEKVTVILASPQILEYQLHVKSGSAEKFLWGSMEQTDSTSCNCRTRWSSSNLSILQWETVGIWSKIVLFTSEK